MKSDSLVQRSLLPNRLTALLCVLLGAALPAAAQKQKPNIIIILADDLGWGDVGYHGSEIRTPNIDALAREGVELNRFYVAPICSPTRSGLMTGRYPDRFGLRNIVVRPWFDFGVDTTEVFLPQLLAQAGYRHSTIVGKWHLGHSRPEFHPLNRGFTHFYGHYNGAIDYFTHVRENEHDWHNDFEVARVEGYSTDLITREAVRCLRQYAADQEPFFLYVAYNAPHGPLQAQDKYLRMYGITEGESVKPAGRPEIARKIFSAMVTNLDDGIGEILQELKNQQIEQNTIVLFFSDNGPETRAGGSSGGLRGHKHTEWEGGVRVPAIIRWPGKFPGGYKSDQVMGYIDVLPTLLDAAGIRQKPHKPLDGISMLSVLEGRRKQVNRVFYLGRGAAVSQGWKLVRSTSDNPAMQLSEDMLFRISFDPFEQENVYTENPRDAAALAKEISRYDAIRSSVPSPEDVKPADFKAPKDWKIPYIR